MLGRVYFEGDEEDEDNDTLTSERLFYHCHAWNARKELDRSSLEIE